MLQKVSAIENSLTSLDMDVNDETQLKQFAKKLLDNRPLIGHRSFFHLPSKTDTEKQLERYNATVLRLKY